ncbi:D-tyrosyl-tRNA(Tyr) deacylase [Acidaminococcus sp. AM05-11]|uniref:D-aminoacyl-tRNA deacylase n=1 Tax=Acidaminococcus sp. AM05-11 TaxID=2291997 RepID=UPI000E4BD4B8|nr:D-aminoacyl-tRNA deacylase [Acidaminococcus sp. AM05-11]RHK02379.1 D-tyrosyl-tRNA(Tyr) deacylase [Acidaminococcus sp. AM05-11]
MRAVVQRVTRASVTVEGREISAIGPGLMVLLGVEKEDTEKDAAYLAEKITGLRIFEDENDKMNLSLLQSGGSLLLVSQFTLLGDVRHGRRPSFTQTALPDAARELYEKTAELIRSQGVTVATGQFQAHMQVELVNDGPVTLLLDSRKTF